VYSWHYAVTMKLCKGRCAQLVGTSVPRSGSPPWRAFCGATSMGLWRSLRAARPAAGGAPAQPPRPIALQEAASSHAMHLLRSSTDCTHSRRSRPLRGACRSPAQRRRIFWI